MNTYHDPSDIFERKNDRFYLFLVILAALVWRMPLIIVPEVIHNDSVEYIRLAKYMLTGTGGPDVMPPLYPLLMIAVNSVVQDFEFAGILVSVLFSTVIVVPVYYLGKKLFDAKAGLIGAVIAAFHPYLYKYSGSVLSEAVFFYLFTCSVLFGLCARSEGKKLYAALFGFFAALAYLTRPEGIGLLIVFVVWIVCTKPDSVKNTVLTRVALAGVACMCFIVLSLPYIVHLKKETGQWQISKKIIVSVNTGDEQPEGTRRPDVVVTSLFRDPFAVAKKLSLGFIDSLNKFQQVLPPYLAFMVIIALLGRKGDRFSWRNSLYLFSHHFLYLGIVFPFFLVSQRYVTQMVPLTLPFAASGIEKCARWIDGNITKKHRPEKVSLCVTACIVLVLCVHGVLVKDWDRRMIQKEVGLWMKYNLSGPGTVMSSRIQEAFYAERGWVYYGRNLGYQETLDEVKKHGVRYLVAEASLQKQFLEELSSGAASDRLKIIYEKGVKGERFYVIEVAD